MSKYPVSIGILAAFEELTENDELDGPTDEQLSLLVLELARPDAIVFESDIVDVQRRRRRVADIPVARATHFCPRVNSYHVHRGSLVQPARRSYSVAPATQARRIMPVEHSRKSGGADHLTGLLT